MYFATAVVPLQTAQPSQTDPARKEPIVVEHADTWQATGVDERFDLEGNVRIRHGAATLTSDRVRYDRVHGELVLDGRVRMQRERTELTADHVVYYEQDRYAVGMGAVRLVDLEEGTTLTGTRAEYFHRPRRAVLTGSPRLDRKHKDDDVVITGRRLEYFFARPDSGARAVARDSVTVVDRTERITVTCQEAEYLKSSERAFLSGAPRLVKHPADGEHDIVVTGKRMVYAFSNKQADVYDSVLITRGTLYGTCDTVFYASDQQQVHMRGTPVIRDLHSEILGDDILLALDEESVSRAVITGHAMGAYTSEAHRPKSTIQGRQMVVEFDRDAVRTITATQNAVSEYHPSASETGPPGRNVVRASRITILLDRGKLVRVTAEGSVDGTYRAPEAPRPGRSTP
jgi:lipopolysaccharide export system protein LptA